MGPGSTCAMPAPQTSSTDQYHVKGTSDDRHDFHTDDSKLQQQKEQRLQQQHIFSEGRSQMIINEHKHAHTEVCCMIPAPVQSAVGFVADLAHIIMPSLFMACPNGGCNLTRTILDIVSVRKYMCNSAITAKGAGSISQVPDTQQQQTQQTGKQQQQNESDKQPLDSDSSSGSRSPEPGDTFGFGRASQSCACKCKCCLDRCCFVSSVASVRSWQSLAWQPKSPSALCYILNSRASAGPRAFQQAAEVAQELVSGISLSSELQPAAAASDAKAGYSDLSFATASDMPPSYANFEPGLSHHHHAASKEAAAACVNQNGSRLHNEATAIAPHSNSGNAATDVDVVAPIDSKLLETNQYLMRRVRKLEITNRIIKEAYDEVQEILQAERQSRAAQLAAQDQTHQDDMAILIEEFTKRDELERKGRRQFCMNSDDELSDLDGELCHSSKFSPASSSGMTKSVTSYSGRNATNNAYDFEFSDFYSSLTSAAPHDGERSQLLPPKVTRNISSPAVASIAASATSPAASAALTPVHMEASSWQHSVEDGGYDTDDDADDDGVSITWARAGDSDFELNDESDSSCDSESDSSDDDDEDDDEASDDEFSEDDEDEHCTLNIDVDGLGARVGCATDAGSESESESESDFVSDDESDGTADEKDEADAESELSDYSVEPSAPQLTPQNILSTEDYAHIDPAKAVIDRYYAKTGVLDITADIEDIPADGYENERCRDGSRFSDCADNEQASSADETIDSQSPQRILEAISDGSAPAIVEDSSKGKEDRELECIALLPADQRIAKFVCRASSHLLQGARSGITQGFMLVNIQSLSTRFAADHMSILCALIESLYQLAESIGENSEEQQQDENQHPVATVARPSALAKKLREYTPSPQQAALRLTELLSSIITAEDQGTVLHFLDKLSEANRAVRTSRHAVLLRALYDNEVIDRDSVIAWFNSTPAVVGEGAANCVSESAAQHARQLHENAAPLIAELKSSTASSAMMLEEQHKHASGTNSSTAMSTPSLVGHITRMWTGSLTPISDENTPLTSQSSDCESTDKVDELGCGNNTGTSSVLNIGRRSGTHAMGASLFGSAGRRSAASGSTAVEAMRPAKQVKFAVV